MSELATCSECAGAIALSAKTCPHCGADGPATKKAAQDKLHGCFGCLGAIIAIVLLAFGYRLYTKHYQKPKPSKPIQINPQQHRKVIPQTSPKKEAIRADTKIICNRFSVRAALKGNALTLSLDTDLPDNTGLGVTASRVYYEKGKPSAYSVAYFYENKTTVADWRTEKTIVLDNEKWSSDLRAKQKKLAKINMGFDVEKISDNIKIRMTVPYPQQDPRFGKDLENVVGDAVTIKWKEKHISEKIELPYSMEDRVAGKSPYPNINKRALELGKTYKLSKKTPLMPAYDLSLVRKSGQPMRTIPLGGTIKILQTISKGGTPWYEVAAKDANGNPVGIGRGWVNSIALLSQDLQIVE
jgi:hypothetical protein